MKNAKPKKVKQHKEFTTDPEFVKACVQAGIQPTTRQASKWRNKKGLAYKVHHG